MPRLTPFPDVRADLGHRFSDFCEIMEGCNFAEYGEMRVPERRREKSMELPRRAFLQLAAAVAALPATRRPASAYGYPTRPVRILVGFTPGGAADLGARVMAQWLSQRLGQPFIVENRAGAASNLATEAVVRAPADGYTLLAVTVNNTVNAAVYRNLGFN